MHDLALCVRRVEHHWRIFRIRSSKLAHKTTTTLSLSWRCHEWFNCYVSSWINFKLAHYILFCSPGFVFVFRLGMKRFILTLRHFSDPNAVHTYINVIRTYCSPLFLEAYSCAQSIFCSFSLAAALIYLHRKRLCLCYNFPWQLTNKQKKWMRLLH